MSDDETRPITAAAPSARTAPSQLQEQFDGPPAEAHALVILWSAREPHRVGEIALLPATLGVWLFGRDPEQPLADPALSTATQSSDLTGSARPSTRSPSSQSPGIVRFFRQRPEGLTSSRTVPTGVLGESISRLQLHFSYREDGLFVHNVGRCQLQINGKAMQASLIEPGDTLYLHNQLLLLCVKRPLRIPALRAYPKERIGEFGQPDCDGMIGESPAMWHLRDRLAACARSDLNVLIVGESGSGKELAAQAIHSLSTRSARPLVADNISAIPSSLAAALLFGNKRNFPNPGMEERVGLIGAADGSMLFLDEIGDMPEEVQPMFLRVAERHGEYFRLGEEGRIRRSNFCLIGATNRPERMRYELKRRFQREIRVPSLNERHEDIPLLISHLLGVQQQQGDLSAREFYDPQTRTPRVHPLLIEQLVRHTYVTNVSEIEFMLGHAMSESSGSILGPIQGPLPLQGRSTKTPNERLASFAQTRRKVVSEIPSPEHAQQALDASRGNVVRAAAALGISRHQLNRMIGRHALTVQRAARATSSTTK
jgi:DNA-binding NtrC family response regulator